MAEVELECAVYGEGSVFSVKIAGDAKVEALQKVVAGIVNTEQHAVPPRLVTLYLARKKGGENDEWLKSDATFEGFLKQGRQEDGEYPYVKMIPNWKLDDDDYFKKEFQPGDKEIHILVELPAQVAAPSGVAPSLLPTTIHRHPERLKRWAAINAMIRQKNQNANQKTTSEYAKNTNKKRKNHDIDKSVGYSTLSWEDI
ncbi:hypothetical protein BBO99_00009791, partial [Phytophthora kernoviae]